MLKNRFSVDVSFRQLTEELNTCAKLADFLDSKLPPEEQPAPTTATPASQPITQAAAMSAPQTTTVAPVQQRQCSTPSFPAGTLESIIAQQAQQIAILIQQLQMLTGNAPPAILNAAAMPAPVSTLTASVGSSAEEQKAAPASAKELDCTKDYEQHSPSQAPSQPPVPGARLGRDPQGNPAWFIVDPQRPGKYLRVEGEDN